MRGSSRVRRGAGVDCGVREREGEGGGRGNVMAPRASPHEAWPTGCHFVGRWVVREGRRGGCEVRMGRGAEQ